MSLPNANIKMLALSVAASAAVALCGTAAAQSMVVRSSGPSAAKFPAGTKLKDSEQVKLAAGDRLVLMQDGKTRTLSGPGSFQLSAPVSASQNTSTAVTRMLAKGPTMRSRGGFSRGSDEKMVSEARAPNLWLLDYRRGGNFCIADPASLLIWRPEMDSDQLLRIEQAGTADTVAFVQGANYRKWPIDTMPLQFDVDYQLSGGGLSAPIIVKFMPMEGEAATAQDVADALIAKGCRQQLDLLVDAMSE